MEFGAITERQGLATTSSKPRYALTKGFASLFRPSLRAAELDPTIDAWQKQSLSGAAVTRIRLMRQMSVGRTDRVRVAFPNGAARTMSPGPSSVISKQVIESFAPAFLEQPGVIWLSESGNKVVSSDDELARSIGIDIQADRSLPDIILVDLGPAEPVLVFVEVVASDGPVNSNRRDQLAALTEGTGFPRERVAFVTAYADRNSPAFRKTVSELAWRSFAWFASEPDNIIVLSRSRVEHGCSLHRLMT
jgi:hypothetical protein